METFELKNGKGDRYQLQQKVREILQEKKCTMKLKLGKENGRRRKKTQENEKRKREKGKEKIGREK